MADAFPPPNADMREQIMGVAKEIGALIAAKNVTRDIAISALATALANSLVDNADGPEDAVSMGYYTADALVQTVGARVAEIVQASREGKLRPN